MGSINAHSFLQTICCLVRQLCLLRFTRKQKSKVWVDRSTLFVKPDVHFKRTSTKHGVEVAFPKVARTDSIIITPLSNHVFNFVLAIKENVWVSKPPLKASRQCLKALRGVMELELFGKNQNNQRGKERNEQREEGHELRHKYIWEPSRRSGINGALWGSAVCWKAVSLLVGGERKGIVGT